MSEREELAKWCDKIVELYPGEERYRKIAALLRQPPAPVQVSEVTGGQVIAFMRVLEARGKTAALMSLMPEDVAAALEAALQAGVPSVPIPMYLLCDECNMVHIDEGEWATRPHKTHQCQHCGNEWRPANVPTVGVFPLPAAPAPGEGR